MSTIELRNVKSFQGNDSLCFTAAVYIDGKKAGQVNDDGNGGCHGYHPHALHDQLAAIAATLPAEVCRDWKNPLVLVPHADTVIDRALDDREARKAFARDIKARVLTFKNGRIYRTAKIAPMHMTGVVAELQRREPAATILNARPDAEAFSIYKWATSPRRKIEEIPYTWGKAWDAAKRMMREAEGLEPTSALKQAASDCGIAEGEPMGAFVNWALALIGEGAL